MAKTANNNVSFGRDADCLRSLKKPASEVTLQLSRNVTVLGTGVQMGGRKVDASEVDKLIGRRHGWVAHRTGVISRYFINGEETAAKLGAAAIRQALSKAKLSLADVDALICASGTMQQPIPCTAALILKELGPDATGLATFDINCTCLSFVVGLDNASCLLHLGRYRRLLLVSVEVASPGLNWNEPESAALMGDGAAAVVLSKNVMSERFEDRESASGRSLASAVHFALLKTYPEGAALAEVRAGGTEYPATRMSGGTRQDFLFKMDGPNLFRLAAVHLPGFLEAFYSESGFSWDDIDLVIPHQASMPALKAMRRRLRIPKEKFFINVDRYGNTIAASIPIAMHQTIESGIMKRGMNVLLIGTSAGFSIGALVMTY